MSIYRRRSQALLTAFWLTLLVATWFLLAPVQAGGQAVYVIVAGQSMEPNLHFGDLVIAHKASDYQVGDVVAYLNADLDRYVIHRIIGEENGRFQLQGDNNAWVDGYLPAPQEILGRLWVRLPRFGLTMQKLREPVYMALFAGAIGSLVAATLFVSKRKKQSMKEKENPQQTWMKFRGWLSSLGRSTSAGRPPEAALVTSNRDPYRERAGRRSMVETAFFALAVVAFLSFMLGLLAFTRPPTLAVPDDLSYHHLGFFSYSADAPKGVYDTPTIRSGEPVFPSLTCSVALTFYYTLAAAPLESVTGTYQVTAILAHPQSGWQRTIPLQEQTPFTGSTFNTLAELDLCEVVNLVESVEAITSERPGAYYLSIQPQVSVTGLYAGRSLDATFEPELVFQYDRTQFFLVRRGEGEDPLNPRETGILHEEKIVPNTVTLFGAELSVPALRPIALVGLALSLGGLAVLGFQLESLSRKDRGAFVRMKYDPLVIDVQGSGLRLHTHPVEVSSIDDLAKLAEKHSAMILHESHPEADHYLVYAGGLSYAYLQVRQSPVVVTPALEDFHSEFKRGLDNREFEVYYQPVVSLKDGQVTAVEALLRWQHPQRGLISAGEFIQAAEMTGDIGKLDEWVLQIACAQLKGWQEAGIDLRLAVNLSAYNLERDPAELIQRILQTTHADPSRLQIEIPEGEITRQSPAALAQLQKLKDMGLHITIDDFVGEVALSSISQMPVNCVKMDRLLVKKMGNPAELDNMQRMIAIATTLGLNVVGKGVETDAEKIFLTQSGSQAQGFLIGRPVPAREIAELVRPGKAAGGGQGQG